ncbi:MAG: pyridoxamine 5'-phosphate oxidase [Acidimicrobiia bacterium]
MGPDDVDADPFAQFGRWFDDVVAAGLAEPTAMVLATADGQGRPRGRHVLLKGVDRDGFVWFTNYRSQKGRHLEANPYASLTFPWFPMHRQVIVAGPVARLDDGASDAYFATRDRASQISAWASQQSETIPDRAWLDRRVDHFEARFAAAPVPRPSHWGGFRLAPDYVEFWQARPDRRHDRVLYRRAAGGWDRSRLSP